MKISARILILLLWAPLFSCPLTAQQLKTYQSNATVAILENDIAFAKNRAFHDAQQNVIMAAIQELVEPKIFSEYQKQIMRKQSLKPKNHLVSVKILNEYSEAEEFTIELEARIQIDTLNDALKQMDLVLKNDTWLPVTLLIEDSLDFPVDQLASRLADFHLTLDQINKISFFGIPDTERREKAFIKDLFLNYPQNSIIYLLETTLSDEKEEADLLTQEDEQDNVRQINGFQLRILRKSDLEEINKISLNLATAIPESSDSLQGVIAGSISRLTSLLTINSVKRNSYENGLASSYFIDVSGLNAPALRSAFEQRVLKKRQLISSFSLVQLSLDMCRYVIQSSTDLKTLAEDLQRTNPYFELLVENAEFNIVRLTAFYHYIATATEPDPWIPDDRIIDAIKESVQDIAVLTETESEDTQLDDFYIPTLTEKEPNNSNIQFNSIPTSTYLLGKIENRGDEDIFELNGVELTDTQLELEYFPEKLREMELKPLEQNLELKEENKVDAALLQDENQEGATIHIDWIQVGKTALAPQLRLYDENFNFINAFNLVRSQKRRRFNYTFSQSIPEKIYIRISDKIGFIQGETGGFKQYQYMIRYSWADERDLEPENPLVPAYKYE